MKFFADFNSFLARIKPQSFAWLDILGEQSWGSSGQVLMSNGADKTPSFQTPGGIVTLTSGSLPAAATQNVTDIPATYAYFIVRGSGVSSNTATRQPFITFSTDNGSSFDTTAGNYLATVYEDTGDTWANTASASAIQSIAQVAAATFTFDLYVSGYQGGPNAKYCGWIRTSANGNFYVEGTYIGSTSAINALQYKWNGSGNFDGAGIYAVYGVR